MTRHVLKVAVYRDANLAHEARFEGGKIKIGRLASAHLKLDDPKVARIHAVIESGAEAYSIIDMGSTDGTYLNGDRVSKATLDEGDKILVGDTEIIVGFEILQDAVPVPEPLARGESDEPLLAESPPPGVIRFPSATAAGRPDEPPVPESTTERPQLTVDDAAAPPESRSLDEVEPAVVAPIAVPPVPTTVQNAAWGTVANNLASSAVAPSDRELEIRVLWGDSVLDTLSVHDQAVVTIGDRARVVGVGPFRRFESCDVDVPSTGLPARVFPIAEHVGPGATYAINVADVFDGHIARPDGLNFNLDEFRDRGETGTIAGVTRVVLEAEETLHLRYEGLALQMRYVRANPLVPLPLLERLNYAWVNTFVLVAFLHALLIASFLATPRIEESLEDQLLKNPNLYAQFKLKREKRQPSSLLKNLKVTKGAKAKGKQGKAGRAKAPPKSAGRLAVKGRPDDKEIAKSTLDKLFGTVKGGKRASQVFGTGGLGGELNAALGGVRGAQAGDAAGLGGLGTRGAAPGGGGTGINSVGLGQLGTRGRGGGNDGSYGAGVDRLGKADRDINITAGRPVIMGSLSKELIRRVIKSHIRQIRYCYEKELARAPGLFGKVTMEWTITARGSVQAASVKESTLDNAEVGRCIASKIRTWKFPKPKGGGIVIVRYPFALKRSG